MALLDGKVAIITGSAKGIGRATAIAFAREGAKVVINSRTASDIEATVQEIRAAGGEALGIAADVSQYDQVVRLVRQTVEQWGTVDILVNNAAIGGSFLPIGEDDVERWRQTMDINLLGPYLMLHEVLPIMKRQRRGKVINVSSGAAESFGGDIPAYSVSKAGLVRLTTVAAAQVAPYGIEVNAVSVSADTPMTRQTSRSHAENWMLAERFRIMLEHGAMGFPEDNVPIMLFLASAESDGLTGRYFHAWMEVEDLKRLKDQIIASPTALRLTLNVPEGVRRSQAWLRRAERQREAQAAFQASLSARQQGGPG